MFQEAVSVADVVLAAALYPVLSDSSLALSKNKFEHVSYCPCINCPSMNSFSELIFLNTSTSAFSLNKFLSFIYRLPLFNFQMVYFQIFLFCV